MKNGLTINLGEATIFEDRQPSEADKAILAGRLEQLKAALDPSVSPSSTKAILAMLASMPSQMGEATDLEFKGDAYRMALDDLPAWAVERQARRVIRGETRLGRKFAPTPAEFREVVSDSLADIRSEVDLIEDILRATPIVPGPEIYRLPKPGAVKYSEVAHERVTQSAGDWKHPISNDFVDELKARKAKREAVESATPDRRNAG